MKIGDRIHDRRPGAWSGAILRLYLAGDDDPDGVEEVDTDRDTFAMVVRLDNGRFLAFDIHRPGDVQKLLLN